jgi:hypothetical protein
MQLGKSELRLHAGKENLEPISRYAPQWDSEDLENF